MLQALKNSLGVNARNPRKTCIFTMSQDNEQHVRICILTDVITKQ